MSQDDIIINRPIPIDKETIWDKSQTIMSKTDLFGTIEYVNQAFADVSGYEEDELMAHPHNIIRHPDMPKVIFKVLWENIKAGNQFHGIVKNLTKSGRYYWVITDFEYSRDAKGTIQNYIARRKAVPENVITNHIAPLYKKLLEIEHTSGVSTSEKYLTGYLEDQNLSYVELITKLMVENEEKSPNPDSNKKKEGFFSRFFGK
jgi:PAS domain S-box-containing protein